MLEEAFGKAKNLLASAMYYPYRMMNKKKKAPARAKAHESYILSTKLFCGYCKSAMTGVSGKGKMGKTDEFPVFTIPYLVYICPGHDFQCTSSFEMKHVRFKTFFRIYILCLGLPLKIGGIETPQYF